MWFRNVRTIETTSTHSHSSIRLWIWFGCPFSALCKSISSKQISMYSALLCYALCMKWISPTNSQSMWLTRWNNTKLHLIDKITRTMRLRTIWLCWFAHLFIGWCSFVRLNLLSHRPGISLFVRQRVLHLCSVDNFAVHKTDINLRL